MSTNVNLFSNCCPGCDQVVVYCIILLRLCKQFLYNIHLPIIVHICDRFYEQVIMLIRLQD
jgi:hypothetical protein